MEIIKTKYYQPFISDGGRTKKNKEDYE